MLLRVIAACRVAHHTHRGPPGATALVDPGTKNGWGARFSRNISGGGLTARCKPGVHTGFGAPSLDSPDERRPPTFEQGVTAERVRQLCQQAQITEAVEALGVLVQTDCVIARSVFYTVIKKCVVQRDLVMGRRVHALIVEQGYGSDTFLCNHIMRMYASHVMLQEAMDVFTLVAKPDAFMWSSIISSHVNHGEAKQAIQLYHRMRRSGVKPDGHVFAAALQACARARDLTAGQQVHADVLGTAQMGEGGVMVDVVVGCSLVNMYAKCGSLEDAQGVFDGLGRKNVLTWNAMIGGYSQQGMAQEALYLYSAMQEEGTVAPDTVTFLCLLQACASVGTPGLEKGKQLHAQIIQRGHQADVCVANSLVNMYAKCGSLEEAQRVFDGLCKKDVVTWTALIAGYAQQGMGQEALRVYSAMQEGGIVVPDSVTLVSLLQACASLGTVALENGKQLHAHIGELRLEVDAIVGCSLVNMYAKCGSLEDAQGVFDCLGQKNVVTWNALIAGYSHRGMGPEALRVYRAMQEEGIVAPDSVTFLCLLQACASMGPPALERGRQLHAQTREQLQSNAFVANSLVNMYVKCGSLEDAERLFHVLDQKDVVTWTALIAGYSQQGMAHEALGLYSAMQEQGNSIPDSLTFVSLLQACASIGTLAWEKGKQLHKQIREQGLEVDEILGFNLVNMYAKCGCLEDAQIVFGGLGQKNVQTWTALIAGYSRQGMGQEALHLYNSMQQEGMIVPDSVTFVCLLQACASVGILALEKGRQLHAQIRGRGLEPDVFISSSLVNMYAKCGSLENAQEVFDGLGQKNVVTWNAMIAGYSQQGMGQEALHLHIAMQQEGITAPDSMTFVSLLQACASVGTPALEKGKQLHAEIREQGLESDVFVATSLVDMYAKCGNLEYAQGVFDGLDQKNVVTWSAMIKGYSQQGMALEALHLYSAMQDEGIVAPNSVTFVCLLQACADVAALHLGRQLHAHIEEQGLQRDVLVASSLINMYGKSGSMVDAQQVFDAMPERDDVAWNALIAGYTRQGDSAGVLDLFHSMREDDIQPAGITFLSVLTACSHAGLVNRGREYFKAMSRHFGITPTVEHYTCMVDLLGRAGRIHEALALVRAMPILPNAAVWRTLLGACQKWDNVEVGRHAFDEAVKLDNKDAAAYVLMSNICTNACMWEQAEEMQARRIGIRAWKQPGQSWWTDNAGLVHIFVVGDKRHPEIEHIYARLKQLFSEVKRAADMPLRLLTVT